MVLRPSLLLRPSLALRPLLAAAMVLVACDDARLIPSSARDSGASSDSDASPALDANLSDGGGDADLGAEPSPDASASDATIEAGDAEPRAADGGAGACTSLPADRASLVYALNASGSGRSIAWDGRGYGVTWSALESSMPVRYGTSFARLSPSGDLVPASAHRVFAGNEHEGPSALAVGQGGFGVAMIRGSASGMTVANRVWFARLDPDGALVPGTARLLSGEHPPHHSVAIAWSPTLRIWAVAWQGTVPLGGGLVEHHTYLSRIAEDGSVLMPEATQLDALVSTNSPGEAPSLVWTGDRFAIALAEFNMVGAARVVVVEIDPLTAAITRRIVIDSVDRPHRATLATDGEIYGVAWMGIVSSDPNHNTMHFRAASVGGDAIGSTRTIGDPALRAGEPSVVFAGSTFRLYFHSDNATTGDTWRAQLDRAGTIIGTPGPVTRGTPPFSTVPLAATDGCNDAVLWTAVQNVSPQTAEIRAAVLRVP
jgi:hypothetical protein